MKKILIIGGVAGGATCATRLRRMDEEAQIILLERGEYISYANCGLPYYIGDVIQSRSALLLQTPEAMKERYAIDVRVKNEAIAIDREGKKVTIKRLDTGELYEETYDTLVISTGSSPLKPPIPGIDSPRIRTLWTVPDMDGIKALVRQEGIRSAAVIGGGFIGLEMAENLHQAGLKVSIVEMLDQVMAPIDYEMAQLVHENIAQNGVDLHLGDGVSAFNDDGGSVEIELKSGKKISADLVILSIGVRPNGELAKDAGLAINARGGIVTDEYLRTADENIYAIGDVIEVEDYIFKDATMVPLAGPANKQGRIAANNIAGGTEKYDGTQGTSIAQVFDLTAASTGANEKTLIRRGLVKSKDYESVIITQNSHGGYYPGATPMIIKMLFSMDGEKIYGAQIVGRDGVDKRIDTIATTMRLNGGIAALKNLELAYAPPYSSAKDPVNMAAYTAENVLQGKVKFAAWDVIEKNPDAVLLDIREPVEAMTFAIPNVVSIRHGEIRARFDELDRTKDIVILCGIGVRSYNVARILMQKGFENVYVYPAGTRFYRSTHYKAEALSLAAEIPVSNTGEPLIETEAAMTMTLNCSGMQCPGPIMKVYETMNSLKDGDILEVTASDPGFPGDIEAWSRRTGNTLLNKEKRGKEYVAILQKGLGGGIATAQASAAPATTAAADGKTIIVFSGDLDKVLASFIIANGAAAMGRPVTMFFTFWGLSALRKEEKQPVKKSAMEAMFGAMLPRGSKKLKISKMNMAGMGTAMMKKIMGDKNVDSLETLIQKAMDAGIKIVACTMSMDVMGIKPEELMEGVTLGGVGAYLGDAEESNVNLFI